MPPRATRSRQRLSLLLLCDDSPSHAPNVLEHIRALRRFTRHQVDVFNPRGLSHSRRLRFERYDVAIVHYTIVATSDAYFAPWFREQLAGFGGLKVQFIQDEYRWVDATTARMRELGIDVVYSSVPTDAVPDVYGARLPGVDVLPTLTGYVPAKLEGRPREPLRGRPLDVVYRGRSIPYWLGRLGQDKVAIGREFLARAAATDLRCDIAWTEAERIYGDAWYPFLGSSRTTLGTESGASIIDFDGSLQGRTEGYLRERPAASFEEVEREILAPHEGNAVIEAISPRVFEAAALGTAMVNFVGRYSDVIEPWTHYVPLEKDCSNFDEVVEAIHDDAALDTMAARSHEDLVASERFSLRRFVEEVDCELEARVRPAERLPRPRLVREVNRMLLAADQLRSPDRRSELPLAVSLRRRALERAERCLIDRFPELEALAQRAAAEARVGAALRRDVVRLAVAAAAHLRELRYFGPPFDVRIELEDSDSRLVLVGTPEPAGEETGRAPLRDRVTSAIREGRLREIVWDNSGVTGALTLASLPPATLEIGYHVVGGAHRFNALMKLAEDDPDAVISALDPLLRARPSAPVNELDRRSVMVFRVLLKPGTTALLATAMAEATLGSEELRRLLGAYLTSPQARAEAPFDLLLKDLFRLRLLGESPTSLQLDTVAKQLVYRTDPEGTANGVELGPEGVRSLEQIVWDHSAIGCLVTSKRRPRISVILEGGVHEFHALPPLARRFPDLAAAALRRAAQAR